MAKPPASGGKTVDTVQLVSRIADLREVLRPSRLRGRTIGLVPTMGFLHGGHMALAERAKTENDVVVLTIFVNPTQFAPNEDFDAYPRDRDRDLDLCRRHGVDFVFAPSVAEMYPEAMETSIAVAPLSDVLIGRQRPGHFRGVATVVAKLVNIAEPDRAYFGEKDFQQLAVIKRMARDLSLRAEVVGVPTVREADGLAASSRNVRLSADGRRAAPALHRGLRAAERAFRSGERSAAALKARLRETVAREPLIELVSVDVCDSATLEPLEMLGSAPAVVLVAARLDGVMLIDQGELRSAERSREAAA